MLFFTCAGGHESLELSPGGRAQPLLRRALSFQPDAAVANGDHVYWDLRSPLTAQEQRRLATRQGDHAAGRSIVPTSSSGLDNETILKRAAGPQIAPVYGTDFRSTPVFFIQDDHDYFDNDDAYDEIVTFPPDSFMARDGARDAIVVLPGVPAAMRRVRAGWRVQSSGGRGLPVSESFGTLRYGRLAEVLLYTVRRTMTMAGPSAVFLDREVEELAHSPDDGGEVDARRECAVESAGLDGRQVGRVVSRCAQCRRQAHDRRSRSPTGRRVG